MNIFTAEASNLSRVCFYMENLVKNEEKLKVAKRLSSEEIEKSSYQRDA